MDQIQTVPVAQPATLNQKITGMLQKYPVVLQLLRFGAIGVINTALDFIVLNFLISQFHVTVGAKLGLVNIPGFVLAVGQSYIWNKYWAFSGQQGDAWKNFLRLIVVGVVGAAAFLLAITGAGTQAQPWYFIMLFVVFAIAIGVMWHLFGLFSQENSADVQKSSVKLATGFFIVSVLGLLINSGIISLITEQVQLVSNSQLNANIAKIIATLASLVWNFIGYKIFVFKK
jgi:putative flippase GtrA